jgi:hypothetical protein
MDVLLYFNKSRETRMPKGPDSTGIRFEGPVLNGQMSVESRRRQMDRIATYHCSESVRVAEEYGSALRPYHPF